MRQIGHSAASDTSLLAQSKQKRLWPQGTNAATTSDSQHVTHRFFSSIPFTSWLIPLMVELEVAEAGGSPGADWKAFSCWVRSGVEAGEDDDGEEVGNPPRPPVSAELSDASDGAAASPGAGSELIRLAGGWASKEGESLDDGGDAPDTDDDRRVSDEDRVEDKEEKVELREELELTVELIVLLKGRPSSPQMLEGAGSNEGEEPMEEPREPRPSSTPYNPRLPVPLPVTSLPSLLLPTPLLKEEKREESKAFPPLLDDPRRDDPASPSSVKAEFRSLS